MPISPWLLAPDGRYYDITLLSESTAAVAADTTLQAGWTIGPRSTVTHVLLRSLEPETRTMVGRCNVVRTTPRWVYVTGTAEDGDGRVAAHVSGHFEVRRTPFPIPDDPGPLEPVDHPTHPTPDPWRRPLPPDKQAVMQRFHEQGTTETMRGIATGEHSKGPIQDLLGIQYRSVDEGVITAELTTSAWLTAYDDNVSPGFITASVLNTTGGAGWTCTPRGHIPSIMHHSITHLADVPADGRVLTIEARSERLDDDMIHTTASMWDGDRQVATATQVHATEPAPKRQRSMTSRVLATVLLTDIVGSTDEAERAGDDRWTETLERHHNLVRAELERFGGREVKTTGDGFLATFESPTRAVECAQAIGASVQQLGIMIRAGVHTGECEVTGGDVAGLTVHIAARIEAAAGPGEVWVSETTKGLTVGSGLSFADQGEHHLKGLDELVRLYRLE